MTRSWQFTRKVCSQGGGQRGVSRSTSQWALSHIKELGLCPEVGVQKRKDCKQHWQDGFGCALEHRLEDLAWKQLQDPR